MATPGRFSAVELRIDAIDGERRQAERDLVEQQQLRIGHQRAADRGRLLLAAGQGAGQASAARLEIGKRLHHRVDVHAPGAPRRAREQQILLDRQAREQPAALRHQRDAQRRARVRGSAADVVALEQDAPPARRMRAGDRAQQRRLAGAVGADQRDVSPWLDRQADAAHGLQQAVARFEPFDDEQRHHRASAEIGLDHRGIGHDGVAARRRR